MLNLQILFYALLLEQLWPVFIWCSANLEMLILLMDLLFRVTSLNPVLRELPVSAIYCLLQSWQMFL